MDAEAALHRCPYKNVFWKYGAYLLEKTMPKGDIQLLRPPLHLFALVQFWQPPPLSERSKLN